MRRGTCDMDCEQLWKWFLLTGLPEAYSLFSAQREAEEAAEQDKSA